MIGAAVFLIFFLLFTLISLFINLPPGIYVHEWFNIPASEYASLINAIVNGVTYGAIIWLVFTLAKRGRKKEPVKPAPPEKPLKVEVPTKSKLLTDLTQIKGIGPKRARELRTAGVRTVTDLAKSSAKDLSEKTGISIKDISRWIIRANEMIE